MPKLKNPMHEEFCQQWIVDFNGARACFVAGGSKDKHVARVTACRWMARADINKRIAELMADRSKRTQITQDMVVKELAIPAFSNFTDFAKYTKEGGLEMEDTESVNDKKPGATRAIESMRGSISIKLHGKTKPLELLGKHVGLFADVHTLEAGEALKAVIERIITDKRPKE
jgi:phage terminase small subunit